MKKRIISIAAAFSFLICIVVAPEINAAASEDYKIVDGSYLTTDETSTGTTSSKETRGIHLMDGECSITNAGIGRIYTYAATTANHEVDRLVVIIYVERYLEDVDAWGHAAAWVEEVTDDYYVATSKSLEVDPGYYYRVRAEHIVFEGEESEETFSYTNGIWVS
ncbi:MAG: DUF6147 family protein [Mediterraneibacter sp.]